MKAGKKNTKETTDKITKFPVEATETELFDDEIDELLKEELMREADELEARLNNDPKLVGVGASDDLFAKIVSSLKAQGIWEEDEPQSENAKQKESDEMEGAETEREKQDREKVCQEESDEEKDARELQCVTEKERAAQKETRTKKEKTRTEQEETKTKKEKARTEQEEAKTKTEKARTEQEETKTKTEKARMEQEKTRTKKERDEKTEKTEKTEGQELSAENAAEHIEKKLEKDRTEKYTEKSAVEASDQEQDTQQAIYAQLSDDDRRAMEYGYQMQQRDAQKKVRQKKRRKTAKRAGITAAALVAVFGVSMTSDANRKYVLEAWNTVVGSLGMRTGVNYLEDEPVYVGDTREEEAREEIREKLNIQPVRFDYLPEGWKFESYEIDEEAFCAMLFYSNGNNWLNVYMYKNQNENVMYNQFDGSTELLQNIQTIQNRQIEIYRNGDGEEEGYTLVFNNEEIHYYCNVRLAYKEVEKIAENIEI